MIRFEKGVPKTVWLSQHSNGEAYAFSCLQKDSSGQRVRYQFFSNCYFFPYSLLDSISTFLPRHQILAGTNRQTASRSSTSQTDRTPCTLRQVPTTTQFQISISPYHSYSLMNVTRASYTIPPTHHTYILIPSHQHPPLPLSRPTRQRRFSSSQAAGVTQSTQRATRDSTGIAY